MSKIVIALGGNALGNDPEEQKSLVSIPAKKIADLVKQGHQVTVGHGNGPQVGMIFNSFADAKKSNPKTPHVPFAEAGAMSQGYIGFHLLTAITNEFQKMNIKKDVVYYLTQTIVDVNDKAFTNPTKPVGPFYQTLADANKNNPNSTIIEDSGRGFRKVVPSPIPIDFIGIDTFRKTVNEGACVILSGGGGIPTIKTKDGYQGVDGVIDKDFALSKMSDKLDADILIILTAVDRVFINYNKPNQQALKQVTISELQVHIKNNQFAPGSMLPKVQAAIEFVKQNKNRIAIIADLHKVNEALSGDSGTKIVY
ncbi:MAG: carbamate kinase [Metamycoplasmataceae bacterium]